MTSEFISNTDIIEKYDLDVSKSFDDQFSKVSIESILFYVFAACMWLTEKLFEQHKTDINTVIYARRPHIPVWYAEKAKAFQFGDPLPLLPDDSDEYDNTNKSEEEIERSKIIKFSAAVESSDKSILYLKIATENNSLKTPITEIQKTAFKNYINRVSDAGVRIMIVNEPADQIRLVLDIYFDQLIFNSEGKRHDDGSSPVQDAIRNYLSNLQFNGEYTNIAMVEVLRSVDGVVIPELLSAKYKYGYYSEWRDINARQIAYSGYYECSNDNLLIKWIPYETTV